MDLLNKLNILKSTNTESTDDDREDINNEEIISIHPFFIKFYDKRIEKMFKQSTLGLLRNETFFRIKILTVVEFLIYTILSFIQFFPKEKDSKNDTILVWSRYVVSTIIFIVYEVFTLMAYKKPELIIDKRNDKKTFKKLFMFVSVTFGAVISVFLSVCSTLFSDEAAVYYSIGFIISNYLKVYNSVLNWKHQVIFTGTLLAGLFTYKVVEMEKSIKRIFVWEIVFWVAMTLVYIYTVRKVEIWRRFFNVLLVFFNNKNALAHHNEKIYYTFLKKIFPFASLPRALKKSTYNKVFRYEERTRRTDKSANSEINEDDEGKEGDYEQNKGGSDVTGTLGSVSSAAESSIQSDANEQQSASTSLLSQKEENVNEENDIGLVTLTEKDTNENTIFGIINFDIVFVEGGKKRKSSLHKEYMESLQKTFSMFHAANKSLCRIIRINGTTAYFIVDPTSLETTESSGNLEQTLEESKLRRQKRGYVTDKQRKLALNRVIELFKHLLENKTTMMEHEDTTLFKTFRAALVQGSLSGGVIDPRRPSLDIWGETFNAAVKLLCNCPQDSVMISERLVRFVNGKYSLESLKIVKGDPTITNSRIIELSDQNSASKEMSSESGTTVSPTDYDGKSIALEESSSEEEVEDEDIVSSVSNTEDSDTSSVSSKEQNIEDLDLDNDNDDENENEDEDDKDDEKDEVSVDMKSLSQISGTSTKERKPYEKEEKMVDEKEVSEEDYEKEGEGSKDNANKKKSKTEDPNGRDERRAFKIIRQDYEKGYYNYTKALGRGALWAVKKHNIDEVKDIYQINKLTLRYKNKKVENNWDVHYTTVIYQKSLSSILMFFCFLTSFAVTIYDNTFKVKGDDIVYTSFIAPCTWFLPFILSLPAICNCYHNLVQSSVIIAAVVMDVIMLVFVKLGMYKGLPALLLCTPFIIHFLSTLQSFSASITSFVLVIFVVSFSNECYPDNFREYTLLIILIEGCCTSVHYLIERYQRDVFSMIQLLRGEKNRLKFNKSLMKDLLGSNLKCKTVLDTVSSRMNDTPGDDYSIFLKQSYFFPKVSVFSLRIVNFEKIVLSSQDKVVLAVLKSVYKAFYENCKKYRADYIFYFRGRFVGVCNMFSYSNTYSLNAVKCVLDTMADVAKLNKKHIDAKEARKDKGIEPETVYEKEQLPLIKLRAGVSTGSLIGGTTHLDFHRFDIYGESLTTSFILEDTCPTGMCQVSISTWEETFSSLYYGGQSSVKIGGGKDTMLTYMIAPSSLYSADDGLSLLNASAASSTSSIDTGASSGLSYQSTQK